MSKILDFLTSFQNSALFANLAIHWWCSAFLVVCAFHVGLPWQFILIGGIALAAAKEFGFDMHIERQRDGSVGQPLANALQDFYGYLIGIALGIAAWMV